MKLTNKTIMASRGTTTFQSDMLVHQYKTWERVKTPGLGLWPFTDLEDVKLELKVWGCWKPSLSLGECWVLLIPMGRNVSLISSPEVRLHRIVRTLPWGCRGWRWRVGGVGLAEVSAAALSSTAERFCRPERSPCGERAAPPLCLLKG